MCEDNALCALMMLKCIHGHSPEKFSKNHSPMFMVLESNYLYA